jgi:two-component system, NtrC family, sensor kinase
MNCGPDAVYCIDRLGRLVYANEAACRQLACAASEVSSFVFSDLDFLAGKDWAQLWSEISVSGAVSFEGESTMSPQRKQPVRVTTHYFRVREQEYAMVLVRSRLGEILAPASLLEAQDSLHAIFDGVETGILIIDPLAHRIVDANPVALSLIGASRHETLGAVCHRFVCPAEEGRCPVTDLGQTVDNSERTLLTASGERRSIIKTVRRVNIGGHHYLLESFLDITDRKRAERELQERTSHLHTLIETSPLGIVVLDQQGLVQMSNSAFERLFQYSREEMQGRPLNELIVPRDQLSEGERLSRDCLAGETTSVMSRRQRKDHTLVDVQIYAVPLTNGAESTGLLGLYQDITEQKKIEAELRASENRFRTAFEDAPYGMCMTALDGRFLHANAALCRMLGYSPQELELGTWQEFTHPDDLERSRQLAVCFSQGLDTTLELEKRYLHKRGQAVWAHVKISAVKDSQGKPAYYITQVEDITLRKQADEAKAFLASLVESSQDAIVGMNPEGIIMSWNRGAEDLYGYGAKEMIGQSAAALIPRDCLEDFRTLNNIRRGERISGYETFRIRKDGRRVDVSLAISPVFDRDGKVTGVVSIARDITQRKQAEQALQSSEEKFRQLAENIREVFWIMPPSANEMLYVSPAYEQIWGRSSQELYRNPMAWAEAIHTDDQHAAHEAFARQLQGERIDSIYRIHTPDGQEKWIRDRAFPVRDQHGQLTRIVGLAEDISARREAEERLRASEERYRELFENASDLVYTFDLNLQITSLNRLATQITGYSPEEATTMNLQQLVEAQQWSHVQQVMAELLAGNSNRKIEVDIHDKGGRRVKLEMNPRLIYRDSKPIGIQVIARDVTGRDVAEMELRQAQKLESVGRLASGIAHEINTPIQFVGDNVRFLRDAFQRLQTQIQQVNALSNDKRLATVEFSRELSRIQTESRCGYLLDEIPKAVTETLEGVERVATIVSAMKEFAHPESKGMVPADLNKAIRNTLTVARNELKYVADVETDLGELPLVYCTVSEMNQVFLNLLVNAAHAIGDVVKGSGKKGKIRVTTRQEDGAALIIISDTGSGIPEAIRDRIFDPFFTTKEVGRGTGQGLAIARSVVEHHKGHLTFQSKVGQGTSFCIRLPITSCVDRDGSSS